MYQLPQGIRIPRDDEYPNTYNAKAINNKRNNANIVEGVTIQEVQGEKYTHYIQMNIDADKIWNVFCTLAKVIINKEAYGIIGFKEETPKLSDFTTRENIIYIFDEYSYELTNDGFLEFGIASYDDQSLNEVYVSSFKYMRIWTNKIELLLNALKEFNIGVIDHLNFIDEFPVVSEALICEEGKSIRHYTEVLEKIEKEFDHIQISPDSKS